MPQASDELRAYWGGVDEQPAIQHLKSRGFTLTHDWQWITPSADHKLSERDLAAIDFLVDEWDFGGVIEPRERPVVAATG